MFERPVNIQKELKETYGVEISLPAIINYDLPRIPTKWKQLFLDTRQAFTEDTSTIPIANKSYRLRMLNKIVAQHELSPRPNTVEIRAAMEQAAKECGGAFTNTRELTGPKGAKLIPDTPAVVVYLPDNQRGDAVPGVALRNDGTGDDDGQ